MINDKKRGGERNPQENRDKCSRQKNPWSAKAPGQERAFCVSRIEGMAVWLAQRERAGDGHEMKQSGGAEPGQAKHCELFLPGPGASRQGCQ